MNKKNLKALYFEDHRQYREAIGGLLGMASSIDLAFDNGAGECLSRAERKILINAYDRLRIFYEFANEVQDELEEEGWDTSYSPWDQGYE